MSSFINRVMIWCLLANNLLAEDFDTVTATDTLLLGAAERNTVRSGGPNFLNLQLRLELKL